MRKYFTVFAASWQDEFTYRLNFILWRFRNVLRFLMTYFLWQGLFSATSTIYGYSRPDMVAYIFLVLIVQAAITSAPSADNIGGEIGSGDLSNYLLKPMSYLRFWFTRDLASKSLNLLFSFIEITLLWLLLRPALSFHYSFFSVFGFVASGLFAMVIYFLVSASARFTSFWYPENTWGLSFLILIFIEIFSGSIFPLDVLPPAGQIILQATPFPYLIYYPISILDGKITGLYLWRILFQSASWTLLLLIFTRFLWRKGLRVFGAEGN